MAKERKELKGKLQGLPPLREEGLRPAQIVAINNLEKSFKNNKPKALDVSLDYLAGNNSIMVTDKKILERVEAIAGLPDDEQSQIFKVIDALLRDYKAKKAYT